MDNLLLSVNSIGVLARLAGGVEGMQWAGVHSWEPIGATARPGLEDDAIERMHLGQANVGFSRLFHGVVGRKDGRLRILNGCEPSDAQEPVLRCVRGRQRLLD
jgi:hypothetical protein